MDTKTLLEALAQRPHDRAAWKLAALEIGAAARTLARKEVDALLTGTGRLAPVAAKDAFSAGAQLVLQGVLSGLQQRLTSKEEQSYLDEELRAATGDWKRIAVALLRADKPAARPGELKRLSGLTGDRVSRALTAMADAALVTTVRRRLGVADERAQLYRLRPKGLRLAELSEQLYPTAPQRPVLDRLVLQFAFKNSGQKVAIERPSSPKMVDGPGPDTRGTNRRLLRADRIRKREEIGRFPGMDLGV